MTWSATAAPYCVALGGNAIMSLSWYIRAAHITLSIGGRFQYLYYVVTPDSADTKFRDMFYGATASVFYTF